MKAPQKKIGSNITSENLVDIYFERIIERQRLEEEYYSTGNAALLPEIEKARERIREVMRDMGIRV